MRPRPNDAFLLLAIMLGLLEGGRVGSPEVVELLRGARADVALSVNWKEIIPREVLDLCAVSWEKGETVNAWEAIRSARDRLRSRRDD